MSVIYAMEVVVKLPQCGGSCRDTCLIDVLL